MTKKSWYLIGLSIVAVLIVLSLYLFVDTHETELVLDAKNESSLPANFRKVDQLKIMGSAQFSRMQLQTVNQLVQQPFLIIDLREETHGFLDGAAISWMKRVSNGWLPVDVTSQQADNLIHKDERLGITSIYVVKPDAKGIFKNEAKMPIPVDSVISEKTLTNQLSIPYIHYSIFYQAIPNEIIVDQFIDLVKNLNKNTWLYFHCRDGIKRTNVFMIMYDMLRHAKRESFNTIMKKDFVKVDKVVNLPYDLEEKAFLHQFYNYCQNNISDNYQISWSTWTSSQNR